MIGTGCYHAEVAADDYDVKQKDLMNSLLYITLFIFSHYSKVLE